MKDDIARILTMVEAGKISPEEASELIAAIKEKQSEQVPEQNDYLGKMLKIRIASGGGENVRVNIPLRFVKWVLQTGHSIAASIPEAKTFTEDIDMDLIMHAIDNGIEGKIIDLETDDGQKIIILIE